MSPRFYIGKYLLVSAAALAGVLFVSRGFGMPIPYLEYGAMEAWNVGLGGLLLATGVAAAVFWHAPHEAGGRARV